MMRCDKCGKLIAAIFPIHECTREEASRFWHDVSNYAQFLAGLRPEQRAEWDRCVALYREKFEADLKRESEQFAASIQEPRTDP